MCQLAFSHSVAGVREARSTRAKPWLAPVNRGAGAARASLRRRALQGGSSPPFRTCAPGRGGVPTGCRAEKSGLGGLPDRSGNHSELPVLRIARKSRRRITMAAEDIAAYGAVRVVVRLESKVRSSARRARIVGVVA